VKFSLFFYFPMTFKLIKKLLIQNIYSFFLFFFLVFGHFLLYYVHFCNILTCAARVFWLGEA
jgi:hypothetical protein